MNMLTTKAYKHCFSGDSIVGQETTSPSKTAAYLFSFSSLNSTTIINRLIAEYTSVHVLKNNSAVINLGM